MFEMYFALTIISVPFLNTGLKKKTCKMSQNIEAFNNQKNTNVSNIIHLQILTPLQIKKKFNGGIVSMDWKRVFFFGNIQNSTFCSKLYLKIP